MSWVVHSTKEVCTSWSKAILVLISFLTTCGFELAVSLMEFWWLEKHVNGEKVVEGSKTVYYIFCLNSNPNSWWSTHHFFHLYNLKILSCCVKCFVTGLQTYKQHGESKAGRSPGVTSVAAVLGQETEPFPFGTCSPELWSSPQGRSLSCLQAHRWQRQLASHSSCSTFVFSAASLITLMQVAQKIRFFILLFLTIPFSSIQLSTDCQGFCCYLMEGEAQPVLTGRVSPSAFSFIPPHTRST